MSEKQSWSAKRLPLRPTVAFLYAKRELLIEKILESDYYITKKDIQYWRCRNYDQKKHMRSEQKKAWDCYVRRLTMPIAIHRPTKEEKVMLRKAGYIIK